MANSSRTRPSTGVPDQTRRTLPLPKKEKSMAATMVAPPSLEAAEGGGKRKKLVAMILVLVVAAVAAGGWYFFLRPEGPKKPEAPKPGAVVTLEPVTINLTGSHYLKLGLSLQQTVEAKEEANGSEALDLAIDLFSGRSIDELASKDRRERLKTTLSKQIAEAYEHEVYTVYFTEFVWQ
jgi:flagellar FliL protein